MAPANPQAAGSGILITEEIAEKVFAGWETNLRGNRPSFLTREDVDRMSISDTAKSSAIYFMALMREVCGQRSVHDAVLSQPLQAQAVGVPGSGAAGGDAPIVVEVYALGSGVAVEREGGNLAGRQGAFELEAHGKRLVVDPLGARKAHWNGATVQGDVRAVLLSLETVDKEDEAELGTGGAHGYLPQKTAILSLPQGSGKSAVAQDLARRLGCTLIVEEWSSALPLVQGALHLTNTEVAA